MAELEITQPDIFNYLENTLAEDDPILREMGDYGRSNHFPIIGAQAGRFLHFLARTINAKRVLELGSGYGYSAMWFARAMGGGGKVIMTEGAQENANRAKRYFERAGLLDRVELNVGNALAIAEGKPGPFDIMLCDIDKHEYPQALPLVRDKLRVGGILICDNMLWHGRILTEKDASTRGILEMTRLLMEADDFVTTLVPIRDGLSLSLRTR